MVHLRLGYNKLRPIINTTVKYDICEEMSDICGEMNPLVFFCIGRSEFVFHLDGEIIRDG